MYWILPFFSVITSFFNQPNLVGAKELNILHANHTYSYTSYPVTDTSGGYFSSFDWDFENGKLEFTVEKSDELKLVYVLSRTNAKVTKKNLDHVSHRLQYWDSSYVGTIKASGGPLLGLAQSVSDVVCDITTNYREQLKKLHDHIARMTQPFDLPQGKTVCVSFPFFIINS